MASRRNRDRDGEPARLDLAALGAELLAERITAESAASPDGMTEAEWASLERIAQHVARTSPTTMLTRNQKYEVALDAVIEYAAEHGQPEPGDGAVFRAAHVAVTLAGREQFRHLRYWSYWHEPPGNPDRLAEDVTDRVGIHQLTYALSEGEWAAVYALATAMDEGRDWRAAARMLGITDSAMASRLNAARRKARELWVAPDESPRGRYAPMAGKRRGTAAALYEKRHYAEKKAEQEAS